MARASVKSPDAFRTISEAADVLDLPQHVLRFWETRFSQIKPMKRSGGRRYYRPSDIALLQGIRHLLYDEGYTIKGVQRILREQGIAHVTGMGEGLPAEPAAVAPQSSQTQPVSASRPPSAEAPVNPDPVRAALHPSATQPPASVSSVAADSIAPAPISRPVPASQPVQPLPQPPSPSLQFVREPEHEAPAHVQATPVAELHVVPHQQPLAPAVEQQVVAQTQTVPEPGAAAEPGKLCARQTETLVTALRTLMDCKAMLDQAKPAQQNATSPTSDTAR